MEYMYKPVNKPFKIFSVTKSNLDNLSNLLASSDEFSLIIENSKEDYLTSSLLASSDEFSLIQEEISKYYLTSSHWESLTNTYDVLCEATKLLQYITAVARIHFTEFPLFKPDNIREVDEEGKRHNRVELLVRDPLTRVYIKLEGGQDRIPILGFDSWRKLAEEDEIVENVFRLFREFDRNWINLYKVYEIVKKDAGKKNKIDRIEQWITKDKIRQFKHTANSQSAIGDDARHGVDQNDPPKEPMSESEAEALIRNLVKQWLQWKCEQQK
ncbi:MULTISPECIES: hypothetical protein [unclassified Microcoleus]|uniref:hypothetical protein n=1 Tax=unclassified Microcoleus TaxID=2642155 RepID=UPI002FD253C9